MTSATVPVITTVVNVRPARVIRAKDLRPGDWIVAPHSADRFVQAVGVYLDGRIVAEFDSASRNDNREMGPESLLFIALRSDA